MKTITYILFLSALFIFSSVKAQEPVAVTDIICMSESDSFDLSLNDSFPSGPIFLLDPTMCFRTNGYFLSFTPGPQCPCDKDYDLQYFYEQNHNVRADILVTIKCDVEKPECFITDLSTIDPLSNPGSILDCLYSCEFETSTYYFPHTSGNTYSWTVSGASGFSTNTNGNEIYIDWGPAGSGNINVTITNGGSSTNHNFCVEILEGPVAAFDKTADCICKAGDIGFINNSIGANSYLWDFGDGSSSTMPNPTHTFNTPGTYNVILYAYRNNFDELGNPLCCCTDSTSMEIIVEDLEGPGIYWISTLCENDKSYYWTDAACDSFTWTVEDFNGMPVSFTGQGSDSICVNWGSGPYGTISLSVADCDSAYCSKPATAVVPIISAVSDINGEILVCTGQTTTYTLPKWISVYYDWMVTGGTIIEGNGTNVVTIQWGSGPTGSIHVDYSSDFLGGLPIHEDPDCSGIADLTVDIRPPFSITGPIPPVVCLNSSSVFSATAFPSSSYSWSVTPYAPFIGDGTANINVTWNTGPGLYVVQAVTNSPMDYCNDTVRTVISVIDVAPPDSITGEIEICPNETYTYQGFTSVSNTTLNWTITNGSPSSASGSPVSITWGSTGPYSISLTQTQNSPPGCTSDPIVLNVTEKPIHGPLFFPSLPACINEEVNYSASPAQEPEAEIEWKISPSSAGSVVAGQGSLTPTLQWNNDPGIVYLSLCVTLCDSTATRIDTIQLNAPAVPTITQIGDLCPGVSVTLDATSGFVSYAWTGPVISSSEDITITSGGTYVLTTVDGNGCTAITAYEAIELPGPVASISTPDPSLLCLPAAGNNVTLHAQTDPDYEFTWLCNGDTVQGPSMMPTYTHNGTNADSTFVYCAYVRDLTTGCIEKSNTVIVVQDTCDGGGGDCTPQAHTLDVSVDVTDPDCDVAKFSTSATSNVTITGWNFGDPANNINDGTLANAEHTYSKAGYYTATVIAEVPNTNPPPANCNISRNISVCIPLAADFIWKDSCETVCFTDLSTYLPGNGGLTYYWEFDDGFISTNENPCHSYLSSGTYDVTLTVTNSNGCEVSHVETVTVNSFGSLSVNINPDTVCVGDPVSFTGGGSGIVSLLWDFGDGAQNGSQNTTHSYLSSGNYSVSLTATNISGCDTTIVSPVIVYPNPPDDTIGYDSTLIICDGDMVMLYAPSGSYSYVWNTGDITSFLLVSAAGEYSVKYTDANGCMNETDPVTVTVIPLPEVEITGPNYICDDGCVTLQSTTGTGYTYQWFDGSGPISGATNATHDVCDNVTLPDIFFVEVTDANGCSGMAGPHPVDITSSPFFNIGIAGDTCEGSPNLLSVPVIPDVVYQWSTGQSGLSITVLAAGLYTVVGLDTITNCAHSASVVINPLPDLCLVPVGCYEICNPDTICGPGGLSAYQWNMNGAPIAGATDSCLIVTVSGSYSLTGTNEFGCTLTSDTLILNVIECVDCEDISVSAEALDDGCCYSLTYSNNFPALYGLNIHTSDADINPVLGSLDPSLSVFTSGTSFTSLVNSTSGSPLPTGTLNDYIEICLVNITNIPQVVIFDWYNDSLDIVCSDTLIFDCPIDSDCIFIAEDTVYCEGDDYFYEVTLCNSITNTFDIEYLDINAISPGGIIVSPTSVDLSGSPIAPGGCQTLIFNLSGPSLANELFCFNLLAHSDDPNNNPAALCCSLDTTHCITLPGCGPCDMVYVEHIDRAEDSCCFDITLNNYLDATLFSGVDICLLSTSTTISINNPFGSGNWTSTVISGQQISLDYNDPVSHTIPLGSVQLPTICIDGGDQPYYSIEIKWMDDDQAICRDTITVFCEPDCGYLVNDSVICEGNRMWYLQATIINTSGVTMSEADITFNDAVLSSYNQTISLGSLPPGGSYGPILIPVGAPARSGDKICITITLHEIGHNNQHEYCCSFEYCFEIPQCGSVDPCLCDRHFELEVAEGFTCDFDADFLTGSFTPIGNLFDCDHIRWIWDDGSSTTIATGIQTVTHTFPNPGEYEVCMVVIRLDANGEKCKEKFCKEVMVVQSGEPIVYPNPAVDELFIEWPQPKEETVQITIRNMKQEIVLHSTVNKFGSELFSPLSINSLNKGLYFLMIETKDAVYVKRIIKW